MLIRALLIALLLQLPGLARAENGTPFETMGPDSLRAALAHLAPGAERDLAEGTLAAMLNRSLEAETLLSGVAMDAAGEDTLRRRAAIALSGVRLRSGQFAGAADALKLAGEIEPLDAASAQALDFAESLKTAPAMTMGPLTPGHLALSLDMAGLHRAEVSVNGTIQEAVLDTGAAYSTITQSAAERLGLQFFGDDISVGAAALDSVASAVAVADTFEVGGICFRNVVFIVLPDAALSFADGQYTIEAIVGFPVLSSLERLTFESGEDADRLSFGPSAGAGEPNFYLDGLSPIVIADAAGADRPLHLLLDTGAQATSLSRQALTGNPGLAAQLVATVAEVGGAGGSVTDEDAGTLPGMTLQLGGSAIPLVDVQVHSVGQAGKRDGILGQDILRSGSGFVLDFRAMELKLLKSASADAD